LYKSYNSVIETALSITKIKMMRNLWTLCAHEILARIIICLTVSDCMYMLLF
jgi:hypothetical protein